jgi:hypothetical protein
MKARVVLTLGLLLGLAFSAGAQKIPNDSGDPVIPIQDCDITDYKGYCLPGTFLDCDSLLLGPMEVVDDGQTIADVVLELRIFQTWVGDLKVLLYYDVDCDGTPDVGPVSALCRPQLDGCPSDGCCGCSGDVEGSYLFSDNGTVPLAEGDCPTVLPQGCYTPAIESEYPFSVFNGLRKGGCFWLYIVDGACADPTDLFEWCVWTLNEPPTPTQETTWGQIKNIYE